ncbi:dinitrogenase iron-molybdenum cofactor biosynthesis protein [Marichromatium bheemlicum]|uniref:Dinitrogenase iron-molybdenum cofactor biosynthesis protein n=1 Tax=Marichromatium bheemlicum TaxID=365339 RepID=A0ABX1I9H4_9GAMM|nr:dinitrogenase iron-molybdenum cofactor biosynthesis protein [Marichromatium bheemlicum]NKN34172.1 dinitrogenase iron-molybdenum cofactor biosynthesis protein [Marichromatium bheemlicum]
MTAVPLSDDIALRIGLAARILPEIGVARLLRVLDSALGLPPTADTLERLRLRDLRQGADGALADLEPERLKDALAILRGEVGDTQPPPLPEPYVEGELPGSIRVACASDSGEQLDGHFGAARRFLVYQVSTAEIRLIEVREIDDGRAEDDRNSYRAGLIADCQLLYVASIGGPAAAKVVKVDVHPIRLGAGGEIREHLRALQDVLAGHAPPWLAKVMRQGVAPAGGAA